MLQSMLRKLLAPSAPDTSQRVVPLTSVLAIASPVGDGWSVSLMAPGSSMESMPTAPATGASELYLRGYQVEGIEYLTRYGRTILADETGIGKTVQALIAGRKLTDQRILVVAPKSASGVWVKEAMKWLGETARTYEGPSRKRVDLDNATILVTNYHLLREVIARHPHWTLIIYDEAHKLRNRTRETLYGAASRVSSSYVFFLTGTPIYSNAGDLWPMLNIIKPQAFNSYWGFVKLWAHMDHNGYGYMIHGVKNPKRLQRGLNRNGWMLRRLKKDVLKDLPEKFRDEWPLKMNSKQRKAYEQMANELVLKLDGEHDLAIPSKLALMTRLRQLLVAPKLLGLDFEGAGEEALKEELGETTDAAIIFTPFADALPLLQKSLEKTGRPIRIIRGGSSAKGLAEAVAWFQSYEGPTEPILLCSLLMGTSWTATRATRAYFLGYDWSPANNIQAEDRIHRLGQKDFTYVKYIVHEGTIDEHLMDILNEKTTVARLLLDMHKFVLP